MTILIALGALVLLSLAVVAVLIVRAPLGHQDETGFHYGYPPERVRRLRAAFERTRDLPVGSPQAWARMAELRDEVGDLLGYDTPPPGG